MPESKWLELFRFTATCRCLTHLGLYDTKLRKAGRYLAQSITSWGADSPLEHLNLEYCSIPEQVWPELLQSLSSCKQLYELSLTGNKIGEAAHDLTQSIASWGADSPLERLDLYNCSIPEQVWLELFQSLSSCKHLSRLSLSCNTIGEAGHYLVQSITSWGDNPPLEHLDLYNCSIPEQVRLELFQSLSSCKHLSRLSLSRNTIGEAGRYLVQSITSWGADTPLQHLNLYNCSIPEQVWPELLQSLSSCQQLRHLDLDINTITGCLSSFLSDPHPGITDLEYLDLKQTAMNKSDLQHLTHLIKSNKFPSLKRLWLTEKSWAGVEEELEQLKESLL